MVVRKLFRIAFALLVTTHRIAFASHFFRIFALFPPFWSLFHGYWTKNVWKVRKIHRLTIVYILGWKICEKCEKVWNANAMRKRNQNSHRVALIRPKKFAFSHFFASHSHRTTIPELRGNTKMSPQFNSFVFFLFFPFSFFFFSTFQLKSILRKGWLVSVQRGWSPAFFLRLCSTSVVWKWTLRWSPSTTPHAPSLQCKNSTLCSFYFRVTSGLYKKLDRYFLLMF